MRFHWKENLNSPWHKSIVHTIIYYALYDVITIFLFTIVAEQKKPPCVQNAQKTIKGFKYLWGILHEKYNFKFFYPRHINQDALENLYGSLRSYGYRNVNPTPDAFVYTLKALIVNNFASVKSNNENCETDSSEGLLDTLHSFIDSTGIEVSTTFSRKEIIITSQQMW